MTIEEYDDNIKDFQGDCNCISQLETEEWDGGFSWQGCDIRHDGSHLGTNVYPVVGYNPVTKQVEGLGNICSDCLQYICNGDEPDFIDEVTI